MNEQEPLGLFGTLLWMWNNWDTLVEHWHLIVDAFIGLVGAITIFASFFTRLTKTPKDDEALATVKNWLHQLSWTNAKDVRGIGQQPVPPQKTELPTGVKDEKFKK